jgi:hypothetical protein
LPPQIGAGEDAEPVHLARGDRSDAVELADRQGLDERRAHRGRHDTLAVGLASVGGQLGEQRRDGPEAAIPQQPDSKSIESVRGRLMPRRFGRASASMLPQRVGYWAEFLDSFDAAREALERYESHEKLIRPVTDPKKKGRYSIHDGRDKEITVAESAEGGCG